MRGHGDVIDLFSGPGGWCLAARELGLDPLGIEWDDAACATRKAAGLRTVQADVAALDPLDFAPCVGFIASPPCQAWSTAGKGGGKRDREHVIRCLGDLAAGNDTRAEHAAQCEDERSMLVVEPLRWILALRPEWVALEQVPPVLELWTIVAQILALRGYSTWAGVLEAERYGVPQTRERAILMASRVGPVHPPAPTHQRYIQGQPQRHEHTFDGEILPWVSMAEALGWGMTGRPSGTVVTPRQGGGPSGALDGGSHAREVMRTARAKGEWVETGNFTAVSRDADGERSRDGSRMYTRTIDAPAPVITGNVDRWKYRNGNQPNAAERPVDEPAPTVAFGHNSSSIEWVAERPAPTIVGTRRSSEGMLVGRQLPAGEGTNVGGWGWNPRQNGGTVRDGGEPAPTVLADGLAKGVPVWDDTRECPKAGPNAVRVTVQEAAILQSFPPDYPWQGSRSAQYQQVGNAIPPKLARAVLSMLVVEPALERAA